MKKLILVVLFLTFISGCGSVVEVESTTSWRGNVNGATVEGSGNKSFDLDGDKCVVFSKKTKAGKLKIKIKSGIFQDGEEKETTAEYGYVSACTSD